jgi:hypothetical protein
VRERRENGRIIDTKLQFDFEGCSAFLFHRATFQETDSQSVYTFKYTTVADAHA